MPPELSVVIPALNEASSLPGLLSDLARQGLNLEIIVADAGSADGTTVIARKSGARVISAHKGRGRQMNAGAAESRSRTLLFLHADSRLDAAQMLGDALKHFEQEVEHHGERVAGHFGLVFDRTQETHSALYRFMEAKTRSGRCGTINGDQGLMIRRGYFDQLQGFDERLPFLEDQRIAQKIFDAGHWTLLPGQLRTSARRFESEGPLSRYALMGLMMAMHDAGFDDFFDSLPGLYAEQSQTRELDPEPFIRTARRAVLKQLRRDPGLLLHMGRFARSNVWQLALAADLHLECEPSLMQRFEQGLETRLDNRIVDVASALVGAGALFALWPLAERLREKLLDSAAA